MSDRIANSWEAAKWLAQNGTGGGSAVNDTYLATITSSLENSLAAPTGEIPLFVGGKGSGNSVNPADREHSDGYYWVTQTSHTENIPYALINQLELNVESHSRTLL
ncbi:hypothetical protein ACTNCI_12405, partial [Mitsuokella jalaludinii]|uniref:hypothetical protein n=1 Tax=Mitsuokella jalaludinii TaxID=187979 RepID=UPI003F8C4EE9